MTQMSFIDAQVNKEMKCSIFQDVFTNIYYSTLLGGGFSNCHGQGTTPNEAMTSLKMRMYQLRDKQN